MPAAMDGLPELAGDAKLLLAAASGSWAVPLELKLLGALVLLLLFLLFLIVVVWDRYGREISELYTGAGAHDGAAGRFLLGLSAVSRQRVYNL